MDSKADSYNFDLTDLILTINQDGHLKVEGHTNPNYQGDIHDILLHDTFTSSKKDWSYDHSRDPNKTSTNPNIVWYWNGHWCHYKK